MHHSNKVVTAVVWLLTSLAAVHVGLVSLGWNLLEHPLFMRSELLQRAIVPLHYVVGLAGLWSLIMYVQWVVSGCAECHCKMKK